MVRTVFRMNDPVYMLARYAGGHWIDAWSMYRQMRNGDGPERITAEDAATAMAHMSVNPQAPVSGPIVPPLEERRAIVIAVRKAWAGVQIPPGAESIPNFPPRRFS